jgi:hypothetical protein
MVITRSQINNNDDDNNETNKNVLLKNKLKELPKEKLKELKKKLTRKQDFYIGDSVRVQLKGNTLNKLAYNWSEEVYEISKVITPKEGSTKPYQYKVKDENGDELKTIYLPNELQLIKAIKNPIQSEKKYNVSSIKDARIVKKNNKLVRELLISWVGYKGEDTWEPYDQIVIDAPKVVNQFERKYNVKWGDKTVSLKK